MSNLLIYVVSLDVLMGLRIYILTFAAHLKKVSIHVGIAQLVRVSP